MPTQISKPQPIAIFINREIRRVPFNWQHPKDETGEYLPLNRRNDDTPDEIEDLLAKNQTEQEIESGQMPDFSNVPGEQMGICVYETTTEGTPSSPVFPDTADGRHKLIDYCARHVSIFAEQRADPTHWEEILFGEGSVTIQSDGIALIHPPKHVDHQKN